MITIYITVFIHPFTHISKCFTSCTFIFLSCVCYNIMYAPHCVIQRLGYYYSFPMLTGI